MSFSSTPRWSLLGCFWLSFPLPQLVFYNDPEFQGALNICLVFQSWMAEESMFLTPISELRGGYCCLLPSSRKPLFILRMSSGSGLCGWVLDHQRGNSYCFNVSHSALISFVHWVLCSLDKKFKSIVMKFENLLWRSPHASAIYYSFPSNKRPVLLKARVSIYLAFHPLQRKKYHLQKPTSC